MASRKDTKKDRENVEFHSGCLPVCLTTKLKKNAILFKRKKSCNYILKKKKKSRGEKVRIADLDVVVLVFQVSDVTSTCNGVVTLAPSQKRRSIFLLHMATSGQKWNDMHTF